MADPKLQVIRQSSFKATPWKNGGGITHEALRVPPGDGPFRWRVSVAHIDVSGPFSDFAGYQRKMVLLRGAGIELRFADGQRTFLRRMGDLAEFDGGLATDGQLLNGPCVDLNLMVSNADRVEARVVPVREAVELSALLAARDSTLVFCIEGSVTLECDTGETATLDAGDLAVLTGSSARLSPLTAGEAGLVFLASVAEGAAPWEVC